MKKFYVYYGDFANSYRVAWAETPEQIKQAENKGYTRITRKEAERLCVKENFRRKKNYNFSGYSSNVIYPIDWVGYEKMYKNRYIMEYI